MIKAADNPYDRIPSLAGRNAILSIPMPQEDANLISRLFTIHIVILLVSTLSNNVETFPVWDCDLEHNAWLNLCNSDIKINSNFYATTDKVEIGKSGNCNITEVTLDALKVWWKQSEAKDLSGNKNKYSGAIKNFGRMATGEVKGFACTYSNCNKNTPNTLMCVYDKKLQPDDLLYTTVTDENDVCAPADCKCEKRLCQYEYTGAEKANPRPLCAQDGMTFDMQTMATNMHNYYRRVLATGWGEDSNGYAPRAKQLPALEYNCKDIGKKTLALIDCTKVDSLHTITATPGYTLNYHKESYKVSREETLEKAITSWWEQVKGVDINDKAEYTAEVRDKAKFFAPMVLEGATQIGCAVKDCRSTGYTVAACQYNT
ncbi:SCP-like protein [Ancylostoma ceylanicum]|uniref:SCP-like protein n=1 Tax=Ancylostoma ceylanicum TaxID=53326 RepID=A0A0D6LVH1_9BILA|nr:SCP-like protein [Ancylostoma ceylanicum]